MHSTMQSLHVTNGCHRALQQAPPWHSLRPAARLAYGQQVATTKPRTCTCLTDASLHRRILTAARSTPRRAARQNGTACTAARSGDAEPGGASDAGDDREADGLAAVADRLSLAVAAEDYARAAALRDELARRTQDGREAVLDANQRFYDAFQSCSRKAMADVWGEGEHVQCIHPVSGVIAGREDVLASWEMVLGAGGSVNIRLAELRVALLGADRAFVTCTELINATDNRGRIAATNLFEKQAHFV